MAKKKKKSFGNCERKGLKIERGQTFERDYGKEKKKNTAGGASENTATQARHPGSRELELNKQPSFSCSFRLVIVQLNHD